MNPRVSFLALMVLLFAANAVVAQKNKIKKEPTQMNADTNSVNGKAAMRGSASLKAFRDSLQAFPVVAPPSVVDTFEAGPRPTKSFSLVKASDFQAAHLRIDEARTELAKTAEALSLASKSGKYENATLEAKAASIAAQTAHLDAISKRLAEIEKKWTVGRAPVPPVKAAEPVKPAVVAKPAVVPGVPSAKGQIKGQPASSSPAK